MINRFLNHFEEFLIASFMAAATLVTFAAVVMRYTTGSGIDWAQELTIYLFIWMAKFGAAYGVRTGIPADKTSHGHHGALFGHYFHRFDFIFRRALGVVHPRHRTSLAGS